MTRLSASKLIFVFALSILSFSCTDHNIPGEKHNPVIKTGQAEYRVNGDMDFQINFTDLGTNKPKEYGVSYLYFDTVAPNDQLYIDNPGVIIEKFASPYPAVLGISTQTHPKFKNSPRGVYYRAYVIAEDGFVFYGERKEYIIPIF